MQQTPQSELVLTSDGKIYHLDLAPGDIADTVITVGDPERVARISSHFDSIELRTAKREFVTHTGHIGGKRITVLSTGIGPDNMDIAINELDALANYDFALRVPKAQHRALNIIRLGTSGSLQEDIAPGQVVLSRFGLGFDNLMHFYQTSPTLREAQLFDDFQEFLSFHFELPTLPYMFEGSAHLAERLGAGLEQVITITSPGFYGPQGRQLRAPIRIGADQLDQLRHFRFLQYRIANFEMETSALFGLSRMLGHHAISCNVILGNRVRKTFVDDTYAVVDEMIRQLLPRITVL
jgi:uridine phosphorylase